MVGRAPYASSIRGRIIGDTGGFVKLLFRRSDLRFLKTNRGMSPMDFLLPEQPQFDSPNASPWPGGFVVEPFYQVHGTRDLVDYFPVYLNIGSLFQSNALSAGISVTDTNYHFILSQADSVLRFVYTDLTPTNYMNFLRDTNEAGSLAYAAAGNYHATRRAVVAIVCGWHCDEQSGHHFGGSGGPTRPSR